MATWSTGYVNDLPDSAFLFIESGGSKDSDGKTTPRSLRHFPYKDASGAVDLPHLRNALARIPQSSLPADVRSRLTAKAQRILQNQSSSAVLDGTELRYTPAAEADLELRDADQDLVLAGHFARFNEWTTINSRYEGTFLEQITPGAFTKTFAENRKAMRVLFQHGKDMLGEQVLGPISELREEDVGAYYEVPLFEGVPQLIVSGLRAGQYGSSFRFRAIKDEMNRSASESEHNPEGLPERTIQEAKVMEFGPVTFPAYEGATAGLRSATDWWRERNLLSAFEALTAERAAALDETEGVGDQPTTDLEPDVASRSTRSRVSLRARKEVPKLP